MTARLSGFFLAVLTVVAVLPTAAWSAPAAYELLLASEKVSPADRVAGLLERNLPRVAIIGVAPAERYRRYAQFPVAACTGTEYFLIAHGKRLIAFGCLDDASAAAELQKIRLALSRDSDTVRERSKEALYDGALNSAAAGNWPAARRYAAVARRGAQADAEPAARLLRLLDQQR
ncbi:MAG: hypothetical protein ACOY5B_15425 [Spirochaetota bacterium]